MGRGRTPMKSLGLGALVMVLSAMSASAEAVTWVDVDLCHSQDWNYSLKPGERSRVCSI